MDVETATHTDCGRGGAGLSNQCFDQQTGTKGQAGAMVKKCGSCRCRNEAACREVSGEEERRYVLEDGGELGTRAAFRLSGSYCWKQQQTFNQRLESLVRCLVAFTGEQKQKFGNACGSKERRPYA